MRVVRREENDVKAVLGKAGQAGGLSEDPLAPVPKDGVAQPLGSDEGDPSWDAFVDARHTNSQEGAVEPLPT